MDRTARELVKIAAELSRTADVKPESIVRQEIEDALGTYYKVRFDDMATMGHTLMFDFQILNESPFLAEEIQGNITRQVIPRATRYLNYRALGVRSMTVKVEGRKVLYATFKVVLSEGQQGV